MLVGVGSRASWVGTTAAKSPSQGSVEVAGAWRVYGAFPKALEVARCVSRSSWW